MAKKKTASRSAKASPGPEHRVVLLKGPDAGLRNLYTQKLRDALEAAGETVDLVRFSGQEAQAGDVLDECRSLGLMGQHKLVVVDDAHELVKEDARPMFERYAQAPVEGATLVLRAPTWRPGKLDKLIPGVGVIVSCDPLKPAQARAWAVKHARERHRVTLAPEGAELLVERVGTETGPLTSHIAKLAPGAEEAVITGELVDRMVGAQRRGDEKAWVIQDDLLHPDPTTALARIREMVDVARIDPVPLRWAAIDLAKKVHAVARDIDRGVPPAGAGKSAKLWGQSGQMARQVGSRIGVHEAARLLDDAIEADFRAKTGQTDARLGLEMLAIRFARAARAGADRR